MNILEHIKAACGVCNMCGLGNLRPEIGGERRDPHVFSSMTPSKFMVIGQNPGANEVLQGEPFVGASGSNFNKAIERHGLSRSDFYVTNCVKCLTSGNRSPNEEERNACEPLLRMEIGILKPMLLITLGKPAFETVCPGESYSDRRGTLTVSKFGIETWAMLHPSPLNLSNADRRAEFEKDAEMLCKVVVELREAEWPWIQPSV